MGRRDDPVIPRQALRDGIMICLTVASSRLEETDTAIERGLLTQAGIVFTFAVEEFGKGALLREAFESGADPVEVPGFYHHPDKIAAASKHVKARFLRLTPGAFNPDAFAPDVFATGRRADLGARMAGLYVDWQGQWIHGLRVDPATLTESSRGLQAVIREAMISWT